MPAPARRQKGKHFSPEAVIVPFSLGWMRELVHRSTEAKEGKRMSDVYYFSPEGTKLEILCSVLVETTDGDSPLPLAPMVEATTGVGMSHASLVEATTVSLLEPSEIANTCCGIACGLLG
ncbi:MBD domain-containing protein [Trichonephila clavipes]|uniref:MBD domain-containing protein n=1 Tax=Trichonephila clavipes TaxID=2585209 RepID=A0A8X6UZ79_TRICX|nr:MBD domain-containing protein [Trichonephila clavipes]